MVFIEKPNYLVVLFLLAGGFLADPSDNVEFVCMKKHVASKTCYYNFKVDGAKYRYVDIGCKFRKPEEVILIDDNSENIEKARQFNILTQLYKNPEDLYRFV